MYIDDWKVKKRMDGHFIDVLEFHHDRDTFTFRPVMAHPTVWNDSMGLVQFVGDPTKLYKKVDWQTAKSLVKSYIESQS